MNLAKIKSGIDRKHEIDLEIWGNLIESIKFLCEKFGENNYEICDNGNKSIELNLKDLYYINIPGSYGDIYNESVTHISVSGLYCVDFYGHSYGFEYLGVIDLYNLVKDLYDYYYNINKLPFDVMCIKENSEFPLTYEKLYKAIDITFDDGLVCYVLELDDYNVPLCEYEYDFFIN